MEKSREEMAAELEAAIRELPEKAQGAICWIIRNYSLVEGMCKNSEMTNEEIEAYIEKAKAEDNELMLALLYLAQTYNNEKGRE